MNDTVLYSFQIFDEFAEPIFIKNTEGVFVYCNKALSKALNLREDQIIGATIFDLLPKRFANLCHQFDQEIILNGGNQRFSLTLKKNMYKRINIICTAITDTNGILNGIFGYFYETINLELVHPPKSNLTNRETEILLLMSEGKSTKTIAQELNISLHTVVHHQKKIYLKLNANTKISALIKARLRGIIE